MSDAPRARLILAFGLVYVIWGSTYLGIKFAIETLPPLLMAGVRFLVAGTLMYTVLRVRGSPAPTRAEWREAGLVGGLLLLGGNGALVVAQQTVPSGLAAVLVAFVPCWMVLFEWLGRDRVRPTPWVVAGLALGLLGIVVLVGPRELAGEERLDPFGAGLILFGTLSWAAGSFRSRRHGTSTSPFVATSMQMLAGGALLTIVGTALGEWSAVDLGAVSRTSVLALLYLIFVGGIVAYTAYIWLLRHTTPTKVSTYAFVNPVVAVFLGWLLANEALSARTMLAGALVVTAVASIVLGKARKNGAWRKRHEVPREVV